MQRFPRPLKLFHHGRIQEESGAMKITNNVRFYLPTADVSLFGCTFDELRATTAEARRTHRSQRRGRGFRNTVTPLVR